MRQYIGARYVPKFYEGVNNSHEWASGVQYEPLTIVTYANNSYTSKKPVPSTVGAPNLNPEYWANTGNYNAQVGALTESVDALTGRVDTMEPALTEAVTVLDDEVLPKLTANDRTRYVIAIGDSYGIDTASWSGWISQFINTWNAQGGHAFGLGTGGAGWVAAPQGKNYLQTLQAAASQVTGHEKDVTDIVVLGGYNDASTDTTVANLNAAMAAFRTYVKATYPNASVKVGFIGIQNNDNEMMDKLIDYCKYWKDGAAINGFTYCENFEHILTNDDYVFAADGNANSHFHPNTTGNSRVAAALAAFLTSGVYHMIQGLFYLNWFFFKQDANSFAVPRMGEQVGLNTNALNMTFPFNTWVDLLDLTGAKIMWGSNRYKPGGVLTIFDANEANVKHLQWKYENRKIKVNNIFNTTTIDFSNTSVAHYMDLGAFALPWEMAY